MPTTLDPFRFLIIAVAGWLLGRRMLEEMTTIVTPETLLRWHPKLIANKYDGTAVVVQVGQRREGD
jgi:hypothetical protein